MTPAPDRGPDRDRQEFAAETLSLWRITFSPVVWAAHFLLAYGIVSLACIRGLLPIGAARLGLVAVSVLALGLIGWLAWQSLRQWNVLETGDITHAAHTPENRHAFLGHAAFLLSVISFIGVVYVTLPLLFIGDCR